MAPATAPAPPEDPRDVVLDALGFVLGLGVAWWCGWQTGDLIWSLWLSSLVIGSTSLVLGVVRAPGLAAGRTGSLLAAKVSSVAFFTVHFGLFHFVHSLFVMALYPPTGTGDATGAKFSFGAIGGVYAVVVARCWPWLVVACLAERHRLLRLWRGEPVTTSVVVSNNPLRGFDAFGPYKNVFRMHLLIFALLGLSLARADGRVGHGLVYAVYFFPWRVLRGRGSA